MSYNCRQSWNIFYPTSSVLILADYVPHHHNVEKEYYLSVVVHMQEPLDEKGNCNCLVNKMIASNYLLEKTIVDSQIGDIPKMKKN